MAKLHAVPIALKLLRPQIFENNVKKYFTCFNPTVERFKHPSKTIIEILEDDEECKPLIPKIIVAAEYRMERIKYREPFASLAHADLWVNNFMVKFENGKVVKIKFVDFQEYSYESPTRDLLFYLFTSVQLDVLKEHLDYLLEFYNDQFLKTLKDLSCPTEDFSFGKFMDEIEYNGIYEIFHILYMIFVVFLRRGETVKDVHGEKIPTTCIPKENVSLEARERICWIMKEFDKRKWLNE